METRPKLRADSEEQGFALILVLWLIILLSVISQGVLLEIRQQNRQSEETMDMLKAKLGADAAINRLVFSFIDKSDDLHVAIDGSTVHLVVGGMKVSAKVQSEAGKVDLNAAPAGILADLLLAVGASSAESKNIANGIVLWRASATDAQIGMESIDYSRAGRRYTPRHAPFRSVGELRLVVGMTDELQEAITPLVTVYSGAPNVDISVASIATLHILSSAGDKVAASQLSARLEGDAAGTDRFPEIGEPLEIKALAECGSVRAVRTAVVRLSAQSRLGFQVLSWQ